MSVELMDQDDGVMDGDEGRAPMDVASTAGPTGNGIRFDEPVPCAESVDGAALLREVAGVISRYVRLTPDQALAVALWVLLTYVHDAFQVSPVLCLTSADMRSGKTTTLRVVKMLAFRPLAASSMTPAVVYRVVSDYSPTLLIDEGDTFLRGDDRLRGILNSGHTRAAASVIRAVGGSHEPRAFRTWCAKLVALIRSLPATLKDRSIEVRLRRKLPTDVVERITPATHDELAPLRARLARWAQDSFSALTAAKPTVPVVLNDRAADNWTPLLAIADLAGGEWPEAARRAAVALTPVETDVENLGVTLLHDVRAVFSGSGKVRIFTDDLLAKLLELEESPWRSLAGRQRLDPHVLARMLRPYEVAPKMLRIGRLLRRGYELGDFGDAFARYLPPAHDDRIVATTRAGAARVAVTVGARARAAETGDPVARIVRAAKEIAVNAAVVEKPDAGPVPGELVDAARTLGTACSRVLERRILAGDPNAVVETLGLRNALDAILQGTESSRAVTTVVTAGTAIYPSGVVERDADTEPTPSLPSAPSVSAAGTEAIRVEVVQYEAVAEVDESDEPFATVEPAVAVGSEVGGDR